MSTAEAPAHAPAAERRPGWPRQGWSALAALLLLLIAFAIYLPGFPSAPVLDDGSVFLENPAVRSGGDWLTSAFYTDTFRPVWRPITLLSLRWSSGSQREAGLVNVVLLALAAMLCSALMRRAGIGRAAALAAAAVFVVQPVALESVVRMAGRSELLCLVFVLGAMWLHALWGARDRAAEAGDEAERSRPRGWSRWVLWGACLLLALLSKEAALVLPVLAVAYELTALAPRHRRAQRLAGVLIASVVVIVSWAAFRDGVVRGWPHQIKRNPAPDYVAALTGPERVRFALALPVHHAGWLVGAGPLLPDYSHLLAWPESAAPIELGNPHSFGVGLPAWPRVIAGGALLAGLLALCWTQRRRSSVLALGAGWVAITLLAALPLLRSIGHVASTRDLLLPLAGVALILGALAERLEARGRRPRDAGSTASATPRATMLLAILALAIVAVSAARTRALLPHWRSQETLMAYLEQHAPQSPEVSFYKGLQSIRQGQFEAATAQIERSVSLFPRNPRTLLNLGMLYRNQGRTSMAGRALSDAVVVAEKLVPHTAVAAQAHVALGSFLGSQNQEAEALEQYEKGVAADSTNIQALARAGALLALHLSSAREGIRLIHRALELDRAGTLGPLADHIRETAERAERYLAAAEGDARDFEQNMESGTSGEAGGAPPE